MARGRDMHIVVIGGGSSAFEAAVRPVRRARSASIMLEKAPESEYGGNARYSGTGFRFVHLQVPRKSAAFHSGRLTTRCFATMGNPPYSADEFMADLDRMTQGRITASWRRRWSSSRMPAGFIGMREAASSGSL